METISQAKNLIHTRNEQVQNFTCKMLEFGTCIPPTKWKIRVRKLILHTKISVYIWS